MSPTRRVTPDSRSWVNPRFRIPAGWYDLNAGLSDDELKEKKLARGMQWQNDVLSSAHVFRVLMRETIDSWDWYAYPVTDGIPDYSVTAGQGEASSRLAAMRKCELFTYWRRDRSWSR